MRGLLELHYNEALKHSVPDFLIGEAATGESHIECLKKCFRETSNCLQIAIEKCKRYKFIKISFFLHDYKNICRLLIYNTLR